MLDPYDDSTLIKSSSGRWTLRGVELTCGSCLQIRIDGHWINIRIEHDSSGYYALPIAVQLHKGLSARFLGEYTD